MKWLTSSGGPPGFRLSVSDLGLIGVVCLFAWLIHEMMPGLTLYLLPLYIGATFFLFCNVFRIGNRLERFWYLPFTSAAAYAIYFMDLDLLWLLVWWVFEPLKWSLIGYRIVEGPYQGIFHEPVTRWHSREPGDSIGRSARNMLNGEAAPSRPTKSSRRLQPGVSRR